MRPKIKYKIEIEVSGTDDNEALRRLNALRKLEGHLDTDVLEILASKVTKIGINAKVRMMQNMI